MQSENPIDEFLHTWRRDGDRYRPDEMYKRNETTKNQSSFESIKHGDYDKEIKEPLFFHKHQNRE